MIGANGDIFLGFDGSTTATERERLITRFNDDPSIFLFLISTRAGSLGINLVNSHNSCCRNVDLDLTIWKVLQLFR